MKKPQFELAFMEVKRMGSSWSNSIVTTEYNVVRDVLKAMSRKYGREEQHDHFEMMVETATALFKRSCEQCGATWGK